MTEKTEILTEDKETIWYYSQYHIGDWIEMYTTDIKIMKRYELFSQEYPDHCKLISEDRYSMTFAIEPKCMGFNPRVPRKGPALTEEQKQANRERLENLRIMKSRNKERLL